ncbi:MAG: hypothetical protein JWL81_1885, partial [Verrucomicrobiales bacterium]|nr:hypothetical protein [Verrucomicrobiales bacterium]
QQPGVFLENADALEKADALEEADSLRTAQRTVRTTLLRTTL